MEGDWPLVPEVLKVILMRLRATTLAKQSGKSWWKSRKMIKWSLHMMQWCSRVRGLLRSPMAWSLEDDKCHQLLAWSIGITWIPFLS